MRKLIAAAVASLSFAGSAQAADLATMDCVKDKLKPALTAQIEADVARNLKESGKKPSYDSAVASGLRVAAQECATEHGWSEAAVVAARIYTLAKIGLPVAQRYIAERGFETATLEDRFQELPEDVRNRPLDAEAVKGLVIASVTDEEKQTRENAELLNEYFLFLSTLQYAAFDFSAA